MGWVAGVQPNARLRALGPAENGIPNVRLSMDSPERCPLADSSVDLVWCERILRHLNDPQAAIDDIGRVLRPVGPAVLMDADQGTESLQISNPTSPRHLSARP
jgi:ubiquinone/menaquinone biosynthesis C-methylase UbiE